MENIKFIKTITDYIKRNREIIGNCIYYNLDSGNKAKLWCYEYGVTAEIINKIRGKVDSVNFPFNNYFKPVQCGSKSPMWTQYISRGKWNFEDEYTHVLPEVSDYMNLAEALETYIKMYE